jgi:hypothetical protein
MSVSDNELPLRIPGPCMIFDVIKVFRDVIVFHLTLAKSGFWISGGQLPAPCSRKILFNFIVGKVEIDKKSS